MPAGTTPPDPWKLYADFFDAIDDAEDMTAVAEICNRERTDAGKARDVADVIVEKYPVE
jgi:hypothetical protein